MTGYDVVVVGGGIAGTTAGLFSARRGDSTVVVSGGLPGGQLLNITSIEDFPGFPTPVSGFELGPGAQQQASSAGAEFSPGNVQAINRHGTEWEVVGETGTVVARSVIIASGSGPLKLGVEGEERLAGKGISECASCDGPLFSGGRIGVVGGGDSALQESLELINFSPNIHIFHRGTEFSGQESYRQRVEESDQIQVSFNTVIEEILGEEKLEGVRVCDVESGDSREVELDGLFVYVGSHPHTEFLPPDLKLDDVGRIPTDIWMRTELPGLLAAGDVRSDSASQAVTAAGDGATAALAAHHYLWSGEWPT